MTTVTLERNWRAGYVLLSYVVAVIGCNSSLQTARFIEAKSSLKSRILWLLCTSVSLSAGGIFAMHFLGMQALEYQIPDTGQRVEVRFDPGLTVLSVVVPTFTCFFGFWVVTTELQCAKPNEVVAADEPPTIELPRASFAYEEKSMDDKHSVEEDSDNESDDVQIGSLDIAENIRRALAANHLRNAVSSIAIAVSICVMHYLGMSAQLYNRKAEDEMQWGIVVASGIICEAAAFLTVYFAFVLPATRDYRFTTALVMGVAVCAMHYTGMYGIDTKVNAEDLHVVIDRDGWPQGPLADGVLMFAVLWNMAVAMLMTTMAERREVMTRQQRHLVSKDKRKLAKLLVVYKPYIPSHLLEQIGDNDSDVLSREPSAVELSGRREAPCGEVIAVAFTDIVSSTTLWETQPAAMGQALKLHDKVIRRCIVVTNGFEVKTIGDAFMVAFDNATDACRFGLMVNEELMRQSWPADMSHLEDGLVWKGIIVRCGVNLGPCELRTNPTTGRTDVYGTTVNIAARLEAKAPHGYVCISDATHTRLVDGDDCLTQLGNPHCAELGLQELKGIAQKQKLFALVPMELRGRSTTAGAPIARRHTQDVCLTSPRETISSRGSRESSTSAWRAQSNLRVARATLAFVTARFSVRKDSQDLVRVVNPFSAAVVESSVRAGGTLYAVNGDHYSLEWNAAKKTSQHMVQGSYFFAYLHQQAGRRALSGVVHCAGATGWVYYGGIGTSVKRLSTLIGSVVELAKLAGDAAERAGCYAVLCDGDMFPSAARDPTIEPQSRPIDRFLVDTRTGCVELTLFEIRASQVLSSGVENMWCDRRYQQLFDVLFSVAVTHSGSVLSDPPPRVLSGLHKFLRDEDLEEDSVEIRELPSPVAAPQRTLNVAGIESKITHLEQIVAQEAGGESVKGFLETAQQAFGRHRMMQEADESSRSSLIVEFAKVVFRLADAGGICEACSQEPTHTRCTGCGLRLCRTCGSDCQVEGHTLEPTGVHDPVLLRVYENAKSRSHFMKLPVRLGSVLEHQRGRNSVGSTGYAAQIVASGRTAG